MTTKITTHPANAVARLPSQFVGKPNIEALITDAVTPATDVENALWELFTERTIDTAVGSQLDVIGKIVGQPRNGETDTIYRQRLRARIAANRSHGNAEDLISVMSLAANDSDGRYVVNTPGGIAHVICRIADVAITDAEAAVIVSLLRDAVGAGIKLNFQTSISAVENTFEFVDLFARTDSAITAGDTQEDPTDDVSGWPQSGRAVIDAGTPWEEYFSYSTAVSVDANGWDNVINELGQAGFRFDHTAGVAVSSIAPEYVVNTREAVTWENKVNTTATDNDLEKTSGGAAWNAGATSVEVIPAGADGAVEFTIEAANFLICGLSVGNTDESNNDIDYGWHQNGGSDIRVRENATPVHTHAVGASAGDVARIQRIGTEITFWLNGAKIYTSDTPSTGELLVDCSINSPANAKILDAFVENITAETPLVQGFQGKRYKVEFENIVNCDVEVNDLARNTVPAWGGGASSIQKSGLDCAVEWTTNAVGDSIRAGLGEANVDEGIADIEYAIMANATVDIRVYELNVLKFTHPSYVFTPGDIARVQRVGTEITYWFNGEKIYTSLVVDPTNELYFDCSINSNTMKIVNAIFEASHDDGEPEQDGGTLSTRKDGE